MVVSALLGPYIRVLIHAVDVDSYYLQLSPRQTQVAWFPVILSFFYCPTTDSWTAIDITSLRFPAQDEPLTDVRHAAVEAPPPGPPNVADHLLAVRAHMRRDVCQVELPEADVFTDSGGFIDGGNSGFGGHKSDSPIGWQGVHEV